MSAVDLVSAVQLTIFMAYLIEDMLLMQLCWSRRCTPSQSCCASGWQAGSAWSCCLHAPDINAVLVIILCQSPPLKAASLLLCSDHLQCSSLPALAADNLEAPSASIYVHVTYMSFWCIFICSGCCVILMVVSRRRHSCLQGLGFLTWTSAGAQAASHQSPLLLLARLKSARCARQHPHCLLARIMARHSTLPLSLCLLCAKC